MGRKVVVFAGYDSKSYDLVRKLRLYDTTSFIINVIHIPVVDDDSLAGLVIPSMLIEDEVNGVLNRCMIYSLSELETHIAYVDELYDEKYIENISHNG